MLVHGTISGGMLAANWSGSCWSLLYNLRVGLGLLSMSRAAALCLGSLKQTVLGDLHVYRMLQLRSCSVHTVDWQLEGPGMHNQWAAGCALTHVAAHVAVKQALEISRALWQTAPATALVYAATCGIPVCDRAPAQPFTSSSM